MCGLLVSVRSAREALTALDGGADIIDVKEPTRGPLGRADDCVVRDVLGVVAKKCAVSAAMGELPEDSPRQDLPPGLSFAKWGLAGWGERGEWSRRLTALWADLRAANLLQQPVVTAYADWHRAGAPPLEQVRDFALAIPGCALLVDTWNKDGSNLLDWISFRALQTLCLTCRGAGTRIALAGSLNSPQISLLKPMCPTWFAVRGAACVGGQRSAEVDLAAVRALKTMLTEKTHPEREDLVGKIEP